jgi:hypothetical protein
MIKRNLLRVITLIIAVNLISCDSQRKITEPEDLGMYAFKLLKTLSQTTKSDYLKSFISIEEIRELGKNEKIVTDPNRRNDLTSVKNEELLEEIETDYNMLKLDAATNGIKWEKIEYLDFIYEVDEDDTFYIDGELFIKSDNKTYSISLYALFDGESYKLCDLYYLNEK